MHQHTKRGLICSLISLSAGLGILLGVALARGEGQAVQNNKLKNQLENNHQSTYLSLCEDFTALNGSLGKLQAAGDITTRSFLLADAWRQAYCAQEKLAMLPDGLGETGNLMAFINRLGDYCYQLARTTLSQGREQLTAEECATLKDLYGQASQVTAELDALSERLREGDLMWMALSGSHEKPSGEDARIQAFTTLQQASEQYPAPIYDGPFSDSLSRREALGIKGEHVGEAELLRRAQLFSQVPLQAQGIVQGVLPAYRYTNGDTTVWMAQNGLPLLMLGCQPNAQSQQDSSREQLQAWGVRWLSMQGFGAMEATYWEKTGDTWLLQFASVQDDVLIYPDLVKLQMTSDGSVVALDARNYLMAHTGRDFLKPSITGNQARKAVNPTLEISRERLCVIPMDNGKEVLCYEYLGSLAGENYLVYIDASTGRECNLLKLVDVEQSQLAR
nr:germination protein YpeB [bacterium]